MGKHANAHVEMRAADLRFAVAASSNVSTHQR
jgi:hypothetical protein